MPSCYCFSFGTTIMDRTGNEITLGLAHAHLAVLPLLYLTAFSQHTKWHLMWHCCGSSHEIYTISVPTCFGSVTLYLFVVNSNKSAKQAILFLVSPELLVSSSSHLVAGGSSIADHLPPSGYLFSKTLYHCIGCCPPVSASLQVSL